MAKKTLEKEVKYVEQAAKRLKVGDEVLSASGKILTVSLVVNKANKTIVLFDGDMEVDLDPYLQVKLVKRNVYGED
jgi:preprotein translocase subunit YajC